MMDKKYIVMLIVIATVLTIGSIFSTERFKTRADRMAGGSLVRSLQVSLISLLVKWLKISILSAR